MDDKKDTKSTVTVEILRDKIRGSLIAGACGDALGYAVEFMSRDWILRRYGKNGITKFQISGGGKALISDDTQMTLFTANGITFGVTRMNMHGILGAGLKDFVRYAYIDWYYTQTSVPEGAFKYTWLRDLPEMAHRRAPGNTCMSACYSMANGQQVLNDSKGCGGIMRVAPVGLHMAAMDVHQGTGYRNVVELGSDTAALTHKHPLGFLPAALLADVVYQLAKISREDGVSNFEHIVMDAIGHIDKIYRGKHDAAITALAKMTRNALDLAHSGMTDAQAIGRLGEGWTGDEAWAIAVYCAARHIGSVREAIIAAVNHDGDSDSTGSVVGNIMGAIHGYEAIKRENLFCPDGRDIESTLELSEIILALADDLSEVCLIGEYDAIDTPRKRQWEQRYCKMQPAGISTAG